MRPRRTTYFEHRRCENCAHFKQHYVYQGNGLYTPCNCGHCRYPRIKPVFQMMVCDLFTEKDTPPT